MIVCLAGISRQLQAQAIGQSDDSFFIINADALHRDLALATAKNLMGAHSAMVPIIALQEQPDLSGNAAGSQSWDDPTDHTPGLDAEFGSFGRLCAPNLARTSTHMDAMAAVGSLAPFPIPPGNWSVSSTKHTATVVGPPGLGVDHEYRVQNNGHNKVRVIVKDDETGNVLSSNDVENGDSLDVAVPKGSTLTINYINRSASGTYAQIS